MITAAAETLRTAINNATVGLEIIHLSRRKDASIYDIFYKFNTKRIARFSFLAHMKKYTNRMKEM